MEHELTHQSKYHEKRMIRYYLSLDMKQNDVYKIIHEKKNGTHILKNLSIQLSVYRKYRE